MDMEGLANLSSSVIAVGGAIMSAIVFRRWWVKSLLIIGFLALGVCVFCANQKVQQKNTKQQQKNAKDLYDLRVLLQLEKQERQKDQAALREDRENSDRMQLASMLAIAPPDRKPALLKIAEEKGWSTEHVHMKDGLETKQRTAWSIPQDDFKMLSDKLAPYATPYERGDLIAVIRDGELAENLAKNLADAFRNAGWNLPDQGFRKVGGKSIGVIIVAESGDAAPPGVYYLISFLRRYDIEPTLRIDPRLPADHFQVIIGSRPPEIAAKMKQQ